MSSKNVIQGKIDTYFINSKLGEGGMGVVHLAVDSKKQIVIVKTPLISGDIHDDLRIEKLKIEATILKDIQNYAAQNSIVKYIDETPANVSFHLIIEKIEGKTLQDVIGNRPIDEKTAVNYISKLLNSIRYIHAKNIIHRDIKPKNIMMDPIRGPILIDFGAAKLGWTQLQSLDGHTRIFAPGWSCPHQIRGEITSSCDIYAVAAVFLYMLTGKYPAEFLDQGGRLTKEPNQIRPGMTQMLSDLISKAMDPEHKQIATADDMLKFLQSGSSVSTTQPHIIIRGKRIMLKNEMVLGRVHPKCDQSCNAIGFRTPPDIAIDEGGQFKFISKHHIRIWKDRNGYFWIQDLKSRNGTAVSKQGVYRPLSTGQKEMLIENTNVAICYNPKKGPYLTFTFHEK